MLNIVLIAPPASGKGTQGELISKKYKLPHISTGNLIREINDEKINEIIKTGQLLSDDMVLSLLEKRIVLPDCENGFILDGFPRNMKQLEMYLSLLNKLKIPYGKFISLNIEKEVAIKRVMGRKVCPQCNAVYNDEFYKNNICENCQSELLHREDDSFKTILSRFEIYENETVPVIKFLQEKNLLFTVSSHKDKEVVFESISKIIEEV